MVLESLLNPFAAEKRPWEMFFIGIIYTSVAILLALTIFPSEASMVMVFLTVMACLPVFYNTIRTEEKKDLKIKSERKLLHEHNKALTFMMFLFLGMMVSFAFFYVALPQETTQSLFSKQSTTIQAINNKVSGNAVQLIPTFLSILTNNLQVLAFATAFAFIYGAGAIFILTWNASVIGTAIGNFIRSNLSEVLGGFGATSIASYFSIAAIGLLRYTLHGIPEILGYFYGGLAGGIISAAIINKHYRYKAFSRILFDVAELMLIAICFILVAGILETWVTPLLF